MTLMGKHPFRFGAGAFLQIVSLSILQRRNADDFFEAGGEVILVFKSHSPCDSADRLNGGSQQPAGLPDAAAHDIFVQQLTGLRFDQGVQIIGMIVKPLSDGIVVQSLGKMPVDKGQRSSARAPLSAPTDDRCSTRYSTSDKREEAAS